MCVSKTNPRVDCRKRSRWPVRFLHRGHAHARPDLRPFWCCSKRARRLRRRETSHLRPLPPEEWGPASAPGFPAAGIPQPQTHKGRETDRTGRPNMPTTGRCAPVRCVGHGESVCCHHHHVIYHHHFCKQATKRRGQTPSSLGPIPPATCVQTALTKSRMPLAMLQPWGNLGWVTTASIV